MKTLYLSVLTFLVVVGSSILGVSTISSEVRKTENQPTESEFVYTGPVLSGNELFPVLSAQGVVVTDIDSGIVLYEKNPDGILFPASTTKIITALVALDYFPAEQVITVGRVNVEGQKMGLIPGEKIKVQDLIYGVLIHSANDAAEVLAENYKGGRISFVAAMNLKAQDLGLLNSVFKNPTGLDEEGHVTTAKDLEVASRVAMQNEFFRMAVGTKEKIVKSIDGKISHNLVNVNKLIGEVDGVLGVKTGWTENARENLVTYVQRDGHTISMVLLGSQDRFGETKELLNWVFMNYTWGGLIN